MHKFSAQPNPERLTLVLFPKERREPTSLWRRLFLQRTRWSLVFGRCSSAACFTVVPRCGTGLRLHLVVFRLSSGSLGDHPMRLSSQ